MSNARNYSDTVPQTTLQGNQTGSGGVTSGDTQFVLGTSLASYVATPFVLRIEPGTANEELVLVTSGAGTIGSPYVVTRGWGPGGIATRPAAAHAQGVAATHGVGGEDFGPDGVHGLPVGVSVSGAAPAKASTTTISASTTETVLHTHTALANEPDAQSVYKLVVFGTTDNSATGTTITFRLRIGGVAGTTVCTYAITTPASSQTNKSFRVEAELTFITVGAAGTVRGCLQVMSEAPTATFPGINCPTAVVSSINTTAQKDIVITAQWGANSAGNILRADSGYAEKAN